MKIRKSILPHTITDIGAFAFLWIAVPVTFIFDLTVVLPEFYETTSFIYCLHVVLASFILFNIISNNVALILCDTSIRGEVLTPPLDNELHLKLWRLCSICETLTPPRSWHCNICKTCILKRDHHCAFSGCCVGHKNQRYFLMLLLYIFIGTTYASLYNNLFIWRIHAEYFVQFKTIFKIMFPFALVAWEPSQQHFYLIMYMVNMIGSLFTGFLLLYHTQNVLKGSLVHDRHQRQLYNLGRWENVRMVLGKRWHWTWLSPFVQSDLIHNGIHWERILEKSIKSN